MTFQSWLVPSFIITLPEELDNLGDLFTYLEINWNETLISFAEVSKTDCSQKTEGPSHPLGSAPYLLGSWIIISINRCLFFVLLL